jgi:hypothetical protein
MKRLGMPIEVANEPAIATLLARTRDALGAAEFRTIEAESRSRPFEDAVADARAWIAAQRERAR